MKFEEALNNGRIITKYLSLIYQQDSLQYLYHWILSNQHHFYQFFEKKDAHINHYFQKNTFQMHPLEADQNTLKNPDTNNPLIQLLNSFPLIQLKKDKKYCFNLMINLFITFHRVHSKNRFFPTPTSSSESNLL